MKTEFLSLTDKLELFKDLQQGKPDSIRYVIGELDRLEGLIKNYELGIEMLMRHYDNDTHKSIKTLDGSK